MKTYIESPAEFEAMTPEERSAYRCAVDAAHASGQVAQFHHKKGFGWETCEPMWDWSAGVYRIARKPLEVWVWRFPGGALGTVAYANVYAANADNDSAAGRAVRFIEAPNE